MIIPDIMDESMVNTDNLIANNSLNFNSNMNVILETDTEHDVSDQIIAR